mmetsp:Transcript_2676/g.4415  ORF Transcript_2676/g.4415 Transcript_2676/m.4415 type:complete len:210 (-) Transcript_2676:527-1156(-)
MTLVKPRSASFRSISTSSFRSSLFPGILDHELTGPVGLSTSLILKSRSPGSPSIIASPSSKKRMICPSDMPGSTSISRDTSSGTNFKLSHLSHSVDMVWVNIPGPICCVLMTRLQLHCLFPGAFSRMLFTLLIVIFFPTYRSSKVHSKSMIRSGPFGVCGSCSSLPPPPKLKPNPPPPKNELKTSKGSPPLCPPPPAPCCLSPSSPYLS